MITLIKLASMNGLTARLARMKPQIATIRVA
jgi:hypothetical protein